MKSNLRQIETTCTLYGIFVATGAAVVLPGTLLPGLLAHWSLSDAQAGMLFLCFFLGSSAGALLARGRLAWSIVRGMILSAGGAGLLAVSSTASAFAAMMLFGCGLGMAMTSVSLFQSRRRPETRVAEMTRLNLLWAAGAAAGPALLLRGLAESNLKTVLLTAMAAVLCGAILAAWFLPRREPRRQVSGAASTSGAGHAVPWMLLAMIPLATGVESSVGAWLAAYSQRGGMRLATTISTVTCFWVGLLLSRLMQSLPGVTARFHRTTLRLAPLLMMAGMSLLICRSFLVSWNGDGAHGEAALVGGAFLAGLGVGPLYPLLLGLVLNEGETRNVAFVAAGLGSSTLPFLVGMVSERMGSLTVGLGVPLAGSIALGLLAIVVARQP